jgi:alkylation response protein AidB-like acyl-CoA dehydrogenase
LRDVEALDLPQMAEMGLLGVLGAAEYGGAGMDYISLGLAARSWSTSTRRCA